MVYYIVIIAKNKVYYLESCVDDYENWLDKAGFKVENIDYAKPNSGNNWLDETKVAAHMVIKAKKL